MGRQHWACTPARDPLSTGCPQLALQVDEQLTRKSEQDWDGWSCTVSSRNVVTWPACSKEACMHDQSFQVENLPAPIYITPAAAWNTHCMHRLLKPCSWVSWVLNSIMDNSSVQVLWFTMYQHFIYCCYWQDICVFCMMISRSQLI